MNERLLELAARRGALQARIADQRRQLAQHSLPLQAAMAKGDLALDGVDWLKRHPGAVAAAVAAVVIAKPKRAWRLARRAFFLWRGWKGVAARIVALRG